MKYGTLILLSGVLFVKALLLSLRVTNYAYRPEHIRLFRSAMPRGKKRSEYVSLRWSKHDKRALRLHGAHRKNAGLPGVRGKRRWFVCQLEKVGGAGDELEILH